MSVALLFFSHQRMASHLPALKESLHAERMANCTIIEVPLDTPVDSILAAAQLQTDQLRMANGLIIITDMSGGTPSNIAHTLVKPYCAPMTGSLTNPG